jgi:hypothetical protein
MAAKNKLLTVLSEAEHVDPQVMHLYRAESDTAYDL